MITFNQHYFKEVLTGFLKDDIHKTVNYEIQK